MIKKFEHFNPDDPYDEEDWRNIIGYDYGDDEQRQVKILDDINVEIIYKKYDIEAETSEELFRNVLNLKMGKIGI